MTMLRGMASAVFVVWIAYGVQVMAPAMAQGAEGNLSESDFELMRSDIRTNHDDRRPDEIFGSGGGGLLADLSAI